ncbi:unnamed protein product [Phytomonas sp. EM1]|nr:unnamed protein product [Phytomonas sp. EM1]|eukprot:CCW61899.1 unnamed protein product [Phytomonas sp. isolate EM1]
MQVELHILRGRGYPQLEEDPYPCTTQVVASIFSSDLKTQLADDQCSSIQRNSNAPFYNDELKFMVSDDNLKDFVVLTKIMKFSQEDKSHVLFYGMLAVSCEKFRTKKEVIIPLCFEDPTALVSRNSEVQRIQTNVGSQQTSLSVRVRVHQVVQTNIPGKSEELDIESFATLCSSDILVPNNCKFLWLRFLLDKKWKNLFQFHLLATWRNCSTSKSLPEGKGKRNMPAHGGSGTDLNVLESVGDVVIKKWCCTRIHTVLIKLSLTAEKYCCGETNLIISSEEEERYWTERKHRASLLGSIWYDSFKSYGNEGLRDSLESLWVLFATNVDHDPNSQQSLSYELRRKARNATFDETDAVLLLSSLLHFMIPSISYESAQAFAIDDIRSRNAFRGFILEDDATLKMLETESKVSSHQIFFIAVLLFFIAPLMDTITETESVKALKLFKAAVADTHKRSSESIKEFIKRKVDHDILHFKHHGYKGDGIPIEHLDNLGHRKVPLKSRRFNS